MKRVARVLLVLICFTAIFGVGFLRGAQVATETLTGSTVEGVELHMLPHDQETF